MNSDVRFEILRVFEEFSAYFAFVRVARMYRSQVILQRYFLDEASPANVAIEKTFAWDSSLKLHIWVRVNFESF